MIDFIILAVVFALFIAFIRFVKGPDLYNRVVAFDVMNIIAISLLVILSVELKSSLYLDIAFVFGILGFIGVILFARFSVVDDQEDRENA
jgi:multisubunit Na+/H+ antiporter MnhF subunit